MKSDFMLMTAVLMLLNLLDRSLAASISHKTGRFVAKCRSQCSKSLTSDGLRASCLRKEECLRCWASCQAFQRDYYIDEYCRHNKACTEGCRQACEFYLSAGVSPESSTTTEPSTVTSETAELQHLVEQTKQEKVASDSADTSSGDASIAEDIRLFRTGKKLQEREERWRLAVRSMKPGWPLVSTTMTWRSQGDGAQYLVTWELRSGGLRGHLVSEDTHVTLSLWPDEEYLLKVYNGEDFSSTLLVFTPAAVISPDAVSLAEITSKTNRFPPISESRENTYRTIQLSLAGFGLVFSVCLLVMFHLRRKRDSRRKRYHLLQCDDGEVGRLAWKNSITKLTPPGHAVEKATHSPLFVISSHA